MWNRAELKERGKAAFRANYWKSVLVSLILFMITGGFSAFSNGYSSYKRLSSVDSSIGESAIPQVDGEYFVLFIVVFLVIFLIALVIGTLISVFLLNPLEVGGCSFFLRNRQNPKTDLGPLGFAFSSNYKKIIKTMFMRYLFIFLWSLLLLVPGIIKSYEYRLVPYLLAEDPNLDYKDALNISKTVMYGNKLDVFVLDLSFLGWELLSGLTLGILGIFYVNPYVYATNAELYATLVHPENASEFETADFTA